MPAFPPLYAYDPRVMPSRKPLANYFPIFACIENSILLKDRLEEALEPNQGSLHEAHGNIGNWF
jgi:hypothetical protein